MSAPSPRPQQRPGGERGSSSQRTTPQQSHPSSATSSLSAATPARLPPLLASRSDVPLDGLVAAHASARTRAQPVPAVPTQTYTPGAAAATLGAASAWSALSPSNAEAAVRLDLRQMQAHSSECAFSPTMMSPSVVDTVDGTGMPPSPACTIAPGSAANDTLSSNPLARAVVSTSSTHDSPLLKNIGESARARPCAGVHAHIADTTVSARRAGGGGCVPRSEGHTFAKSQGRDRSLGAGGGSAKALGHAQKQDVATARSASAARAAKHSEEAVRSARLAAAVRKAASSWMREDEAAPLTQRHRIVPFAVTVQDQLLTESGAAVSSGGERAEAFTHILDMAGTTARAYWGSVGQQREAEDGEMRSGTLRSCDVNKATEEEAFAMTAPPSMLLLTTDSGARYGSTIRSLTDLAVDPTASSAAPVRDSAGDGNAPSLTTTMTPPPSRGVQIAPSASSPLDKTLLSTQPIPPRWAGTLTRDRQRDHPQVLSRTRGGSGSARLPPIDATASELGALSTRSRREVGLTDTWINTVRGEEQDGARGSLDLARALFHYVIRRHPSHRLFVDGGTGQMTSLASHVAVSSLLLDQLVVNLPRHHEVLIPYVQLLLRHVYVPDTPGVREALHGTVMDEAVLEGLLVDCESYAHSHDSADSADSSLYGYPKDIGARHDALPPRPREVSTVTRASESHLGLTSPEALTAMLLPYARKPFFLAHLELSQRVVAMAHTVRCRDVQFQRLPLVIDRMQASWSKGLLRTVLRLWSRVCLDRRLQERKLRQRWARRWATERLSTGVRRWREYASEVLKSAEVSSLLRRQISETKGSIDRLKANVEAMRRKTIELNKALLTNEVDQQRMTLELASTEQTYKEALERVREMDRVGTSLLEELLLAEPLPVAADLVAQGSPALSAPGADNSAHSERRVLGGELMSEAAAVKACAALSTHLLKPLAYLSSLQTMVTWANSVMVKKGLDTESLCLLASPLEEPVSVDDRAAKMRAPATAASSRLPPPPPQVGEADLQAQLAHTFDSLLDPAAAATRIPLYKYLVLMRGFGEDDLNVPTLAITRLVKAFDEQVLEAWTKLDALDDANATSSPLVGAKASKRTGTRVAAGKAGAGTHAAASAMERLPEAIREAAEKVSSIVIDCYQQLTGTACVVTAEQLRLRRRPIFLVLLAGLFRHYTNWIIRKGQSDMANLQAEMDALDDAVNGGTGGANRTSSASRRPHDGEGTVTTTKVDDKQHLGRRHPQNDAWYYPPQQHHRWPVLVQQQQAWIAASLNALHCAVEEAQKADAMLTLEEQENWSSTTQCMPVTSLSDILPSQPSLSSDIYVSVLRVVERYFSRLRMVFDLYAVPYADVVETRRLWHRKRNEQRFRQLRRLGATAEELAAMHREAEEAAEATGEREFLEHPMSVMPAYAFWSLLCTAGLAGAGAAESNPLNPLSQCVQPAVNAFATLHRPAVFSITEYVVQRSLSENVAGEFTRRVNTSPSTARISFSPLQRRSVSPGLGQKATSASAADIDDLAAEAVQRRGRAVCYLGNMAVTRTGGYTRAVRDGRHVDLRDDRGVLCLTLPQFLEALVRCVHAWASLNRALPTHPPDSRMNDHDKSTYTGKRASPPRASASTSTRGSLANDASGELAPFPRDEHSSRGRAPGLGSRQGSTTLSVDSRATTPQHRRSARARVSYEPFVDDRETLQPATVGLVVGDVLLPRILGAHSMSTTPFELACRSATVRRFFALHHEALFKLFDQFSEPVEATGMVRALPMPMCQWVAEATVANGGQSTNYADGAGRAASTSRPTTARRQSSASRRSSSAGVSRDVGIVSVLNVENAIAMAKGLQWADGGGVARRRRLTPSSIHHCLVSTAVDHVREEEVLFFSEFPLFLCAIAQMVDPNPCTPLEVKVQRFVQEKVLNAVEEEEDEDASQPADTLVID